MLRRRHHPQTQAAGEAEGRQGADETRRPRRSAAGGLHGRAAPGRAVATALRPGATLYFASSNAGKLAEMEALFAGSPFRLATYPQYVSPVEGDASYADNAALKARALHAQLRAAGIPANVLADDSGLEVAALHGRPGVLTADYGGVDTSWPQRRALLLAELAGTPGVDRAARFVCALHCIDDAGAELTAFGTVDGEIALEERGELGFSFDPVFLYPPLGKTFAEFASDEKNRISHRAIAVARLLRAMGEARASRAD